VGFYITQREEAGTDLHAKIMYVR